MWRGDEEKQVLGGRREQVKYLTWMMPNMTREEEQTREHSHAHLLCARSSDGRSTLPLWLGSK